MTQPNTNAIPMTKPFSTNPKLADWVPTAEQIQTIEEARSLMGLRPYGIADSANDFWSMPSMPMHFSFPTCLRTWRGSLRTWILPCRTRSNYIKKQQD